MAIARRVLKNGAKHNAKAPKIATVSAEEQARIDAFFAERKAKFEAEQEDKALGHISRRFKALCHKAMAYGDENLHKFIKAEGEYAFERYQKSKAMKEDASPVEAEESEENAILRHIADEDGKIFISSREEMEAYRSEIIRKGKIYSVTTLFVSEDGVNIGMMPQAMNLSIKEEDIATAFVPISNERDGIIERFYERDINIFFDGAAALDYLSRKGKLYRAPFSVEAVNGRVLKPFSFYYVDQEDGSVKELITDTVVDKTKVFTKKGEPRAKVRIFCDPAVGGVTASASQTKKQNGTFPGYTKAEGPESVIKRWNDATYGLVYEALLDDDGKPVFDGTPVGDKAIAQIANRLAQFSAPSCHLTEVLTSAVLMGKFTIDGKDEFCDGEGEYSASCAVRGFTEKLGSDKFIVSTDAVEGIGLQDRPWLCKEMAIVRKDGFIEEKIAYGNWNVVVLFRDNYSKGQQKAYNDACHKDKSSKYYGKVVLIVPSREWATNHGLVTEDRDGDVYATEIPDGFIDHFCDLNSMKETHSIGRSSGMNVLDMTHAEHNIDKGSKFSTQALQSAIYANREDTTELIRKVYDNSFNDKVGKYMEWDDEAEEAIPAAGSCCSDSDFVGESLNVLDILNKIDPSFSISRYRPAFKSWANGFFKSAVSSLKKLNAPTKGWYTKLTVDTAAHFGLRVLGVTDMGEVEVVCTKAEWERLKRFIAVKYPKMHLLEFIKVKVVSVKEYCKRVDEKIADIIADNTLNNDGVQDCGFVKHWLKRGELVKSAAKTLSHGLMMLPAIEWLKNLLAGMDFDGDAAQIYADEKFYSILDKLDSRVIEIDPPKAGTVRAHNILGVNVGYTALYNYIKNANLSVGEVTILNGIFVEALVQLSIGNKQLAEEVFKIAFGDKNRKVENYVSPLKEIDINSYEKNPIKMIKVNSRLGKVVCNRCRYMVLTEENMRKALLDLVSCERMYQELTIDAAKNGYNVVIPYADGMKKFKLKSRGRKDNEFNLMMAWDDLDNDGTASEVEVAASVCAGEDCEDPTLY